MAGLLRDDRLVNAKKLDRDRIKAINDDTRISILEDLKKSPNYPAKIAEDLGIEKQKVYYHIEILRESGLIEKDREEKISGGAATFYRPAPGGVVYDLGGDGTRISYGDSEKARDFLHPLVKEARLDGYIVVGSPDQHGPDQVRARDGHLSGEIGLKLGEYSYNPGKSVKLDTEVVRDQLYGENLLILGGVLTNTVAKKFNGSFPVKFEGEEFPYRKIDTPGSDYSQPETGVVAKTSNPENPGKTIYLVAGVRNKGTVAAVEAFKQIEEILKEDQEEDFYCVVKGLDMDGDGEIDDFEVLEDSY